MTTKQVKPDFKELKKHGKMINNELHLKEGIYCKFSPNVDDSCVNSFVKNKTKDEN